jgi:cytoskeleton protein RodZ
MSATSGTELPSDGNADNLATDATTFGEFLRTRRQRAGISLDQIANETKIPQRHFEALEHGSVRTWPRGMYTRAMLRAYAESVGIDKEYVADQFQRVFEQKPEEPVAPAPQPVGVAQAPARRLRPVLVCIAAVFAIVALMAVFSLRSTDVPAAAEYQVVQQSAAPAPTTAVSPAIEVAARATAPRTPAVPPRTQSAPPPTPTAARRPEAAPRVAAAGAVTAAAAVTASRSTPTARPAATDGELFITSAPAGARVMVNGVGWGSTPARIKFLPFGAKRIRVTKDGYVSAERTVTLSPGTGSLKVDMQLHARK